MKTRKYTTPTLKVVKLAPLRMLQSSGEPEKDNLFFTMKCTTAKKYSFHGIHNNHKIHKNSINF